MNSVLIVAGLVLLVVGGEFLVRGAASLARRLGMSSLVVGLTVVAVATSAPEFAVTLDSVLRGQPDLAVGNVIGSNTANILLILGVGALVAPLLAPRQLLRFDLPVMVGISVLLLLLSLDGRLSTLDGMLLLAVFVAAMVGTVILGRRQGADASETDSAGDGEDPGDPDTPVWRSLLFVVLGVAALVGGAQLLVNGAVAIAEALGVSSLVIGLTIVAIGTSLPELAATVVAVRRGEFSMAVGNIVGSNIANIGLVLGVPTIIAPDGIGVPASSIALDLPLMIAAALALVIVAVTGGRIIRLEGAIFIALYLAYIAYMILDSANHDAQDGFSLVMAGLVLPLLVLVGVISLVNEVRTRRRSPAPDASGVRDAGPPPGP
ncbi:MAG: calcium/sodium antiporter [Mobilicoccus sp.]|nr:calcium/sodium antiporter [Mobilicoccus sp.]